MNSMAVAETTTRSVSQARGVLQVTIVTETYPPDVNGVAMTMDRLLGGLLERNHRVQLVRPQQDSSDKPSTGDRLDVIPQPGLPIPCYRNQQFGLPAARSLTKLWKSHPADVVYIATEGPLGLSALMVANRQRIPVVSGFHTNFHKYSAHYHLGCLQPLVAAYLRMFHERAQHTVCPTRQMKERLEAEGHSHVSVVSRGVDTNLYSPEHRAPDLRRSWGLDAADPAVLYVGRIAEEKNLRLAVRAFQAMQKEEPGAKFILVGDGPMRSSLERKHPDFVFRGWRTGEDLARHYASGDIFLFPSVTETFGNVTLEAMASGLAVVAYRYAAAEMHMVDGKTGVLVDFGNEEQFLARAVALIRKPQRITYLGRKARAAAEQIRWANVCERFETVLLQCVKEHGNGDRHAP